MKQYYVCLIMAVTLLTSCQKENENDQFNYSIESDEFLNVISKYPNGWIKEAELNTPHLDEPVPLRQFEYHQNGYIKSARLYTTYPQQHLYMEVSRDENNDPLWSKYYTPEGDLWFETEYENGLPVSKKVYDQKGISTYSYTNGEVTTIEFINSDGSGKSITTYDRAAGTKEISVMRNGQLIYEKTYEELENAGDGAIYTHQVPLANVFEEPQWHYRELGESYMNNPIWRHQVHPREFMTPSRKFPEVYIPGTRFATEFAVSSDLYQAIIEQYPFTEDDVLVMNYREREATAEFILPEREKRVKIKEEMQENSDLFELKYGNAYVEKILYGKNMIIIGALRNMPTHPTAAQNLKAIAQKRMNDILNGSSLVSTEELKELEKIWFEVRLFSTLKTHRNGVVLESNGDYEREEKAFLEAEAGILQVEYEPFEYLAN